MNDYGEADADDSVREFLAFRDRKVGDSNAPIPSQVASVGSAFVLLLATVAAGYVVGAWLGVF